MTEEPEYIEPNRPYEPETPLAHPDILCGIDIETTGLDLLKDEITEIAWVIKTHGVQRPMIVKHFYCRTETNEVSAEITKLTHIKGRHLELLGTPVDEVLKELYRDL